MPSLVRGPAQADESRGPSDDEMAEATATSIAEYFDGNVKSLANSRHGARFSVGIIAPGEYKTMLEQMSRMLPNLSCAVRTAARGFARH